MKARDDSGRFLLPRGPSGLVTFMASWHYSNLRFAAQLLGRHQDEIRKVLWDIDVDGLVRHDGFFKRYYAQATTNNPAHRNKGATLESRQPEPGGDRQRRGRERFVCHECFLPGQVVGLNCVVPATISDDDFWALMALAGQYKGLSPFKPGKYGFFAIESLRPRRRPIEQEGRVNSEGPVSS